MTQKFKQKTDKLTVIIWAICLPVILGLCTVAFFEPTTLWVFVPTDLLILYFLISPLFGYVELREETVFIKFGFIMKKEIAALAVEGLKKEYPDAICSLVYDDPLQLIIAVRLSAQCTDERVNKVTPALFEKYPDYRFNFEGSYRYELFEEYYKK